MSAEKLAIVTGGAGLGIGHGITRVLAREGWAVAIVERDGAAAAALVEQLKEQGCAARTILVDLTEPGAPEQIVEQARRWRGRVDALVNNAGVGLTAHATEISDEQYDRLMAVNLRGMFRMCRAVLPELITSRGSIVNIASVHARASLPGFSVYAASKAGVEGLTRGLAIDCGPQGVRVNCVIPGLVDGPQTRAVVAEMTDDVDGWMTRFTRTQQLLPWPAEPGDVGELVAFLLDGRARCITGQSLVIDQGSLAMLIDRPDNG